MREKRVEIILRLVFFICSRQTNVAIQNQVFIMDNVKRHIYNFYEVQRYSVQAFLRGARRLRSVEILAKYLVVVHMTAQTMFFLAYLVLSFNVIVFFSFKKIEKVIPCNRRMRIIL